MPEIRYSSIKLFSGVPYIVYTLPESLESARKLLSQINGFELIESQRHYRIGNCTVVDLKGLGLEIGFENYEDLSSVEAELFSGGKEKQVG